MLFLLMIGVSATLVWTQRGDRAGLTDPSATVIHTPITPTTPQDAETVALAWLKQQRDADLPTITMNGAWMAQLASKYVGINDPHQTTASGSHTFRAQDIWAEHKALRDGDNLGARVVLLLKTDYGLQQPTDGQPLWVTMALHSFTSAGDVNAWCQRRFPGLSGAALTNTCVPHTLRPPA